MPRNFPSFVCYPKNRENFQDTELPIEDSYVENTELPMEDSYVENTDPNMYNTADSYVENTDPNMYNTADSYVENTDPNMYNTADSYVEKTDQNMYTDTNTNMYTRAPKNVEFTANPNMYTDTNTNMYFTTNTMPPVVGVQGEKILPLGIRVIPPSNPNQLDGASVCVDDTCFNTNDMKNLLKSVIVLAKRSGEYYRK